MNGLLPKVVRASASRLARPSLHGLFLNSCQQRFAGSECSRGFSSVTHAASAKEDTYRQHHSLVAAGPPRENPALRAVLGLVMLGTDVNQVQEGEMILRNIPSVQMQYSRIRLHHEEICADTYFDAYDKNEIHSAFGSLSLPPGFVDVQGVACTSLSFLLGRDRLEQAAIPGVPLVDMWQAVRAAHATLSAKRIAVITPYIEPVHRSNISLLEDEADIRVVRSMHFDCATDQLTAQLSKDYIADSAVAVVKAGGEDDQVDAVFLGCSGMRVCEPDYLDELEARIGVPVITSTQALHWLMLRTAGIDDKLQGYGKLFREH